MSRGVKIYDMPEEEKSSLMDSMFAKVIATILASLLVIIIGQGLIIWKDQDTFEKQLEGHEKEIELVHELSDRLITLEAHKTEAYAKLLKIEIYMQETLLDRSQRGGSFRRNDAEIMKENLLGKIDIEDGRISALEYRMDSADEKLDDCRVRIPTYALKEDLEELEDDVEILEEEYETSYEDLTERCKHIIDLLEKEGR